MLSVVLGRKILCGPLQRWGPGRLFRRGIQPKAAGLQAAAASCVHVSSSGGREPVAWVQMQLTRHRHLLVFSIISALLFAADKGLYRSEGSEVRWCERALLTGTQRVHAKATSSTQWSVVFRSTRPKGFFVKVGDSSSSVTTICTFEPTAPRTKLSNPTIVPLFTIP